MDEIDATTHDRAAEIADGVIEFLGRLRRLRMELTALPQSDVLASLREDGRGPRELHGQLRMLRTLQVHGAMTMQQLANHLEVAPPTVTAMTKRLREQALVERVRDTSDSRVYWIALSDQGEKVITAFHSERVNAMRRRIAQFDAGDQAEIQRAVEVLSRVLIDKSCPLPPNLPVACAMKAEA